MRSQEEVVGSCWVDLQLGDVLDPSLPSPVTGNYDRFDPFAVMGYVDSFRRCNRGVELVILITSMRVDISWCFR